MTLPFHRESKSKMSELGHMAVGTCTRIGCIGCFSHLPFKKSSNNFICEAQWVPSNIRRALRIRAAQLCSIIVGQPPRLLTQDKAGAAPTLRGLGQAICKRKRNQPGENSEIGRHVSGETPVLAGVAETPAGDVEPTNLCCDRCEREDQDQRGQDR